MNRVEWVSQAAACNAQEAFKSIVDEIRHDVEMVNKLDLPRFKDGQFEFEMTSNESCKVQWVKSVGNAATHGPAVEVRCRQDILIEVFAFSRGPCSDEVLQFQIDVRWDVPATECKLIMSGEKTVVRPWQISHRALYHLFFRSFLD